MGAPLLLSSSLRRRKDRKSSITNTSSNDPPPPSSSSSSLLDKLIIDVLGENEDNESSSIQVRLLIEEDEGGISPSIGVGEGSGGGGGGVRTNSSKMSNFAKRFSNSSSASSSSSGSDNRQNGSSSSSNDTGGGGGRDNNRDHQNRDINGGNGGSNGGSGDGNNNNDDKKKSSSSKSNPSSPNYSPERMQFANDCTLPQHAGSESTAPINTPSWTSVSGTQFKVRAGPNYAKTGNKESSLPSLYEVYNVRYFRSKTRTVSCMADIMPLPSPLPPSSSSFTISPAADAAAAATTPTTAGVEPRYHHHHHNPYPELDGTNIPHVLIVHFTLPYESPSMFTTTDDGYGGECIYYLRPSRRFLDEVVSSSSSSSTTTTTTSNDDSSSVQRSRRTTQATQLFIDWCNTCTNNPSMRGRFKCMALVRDIDKHNFGPLLRTYNGKPVLITDSGSALSGSSNNGGGSTRYIELTVNVHKWAYMAKKGFVSLLPKFKFMQLEVGFTIEAKDDTEMPECMLGSTVLSYISDITGPVIRPEMQNNLVL